MHNPNQSVPAVVTCDVCGEEAGDEGQATADTVLCVECIQRLLRTEHGGEG